MIGKVVSPIKPPQRRTNTVCGSVNLPLRDARSADEEVKIAVAHDQGRH
jgi:hypothetical protein